ncbi:MAG TPA: methyltransferase domain-containing protein [Bacteroidota bacterium]|nr:methyltransferase domain-containing protein [Bacteroidota bacterium]
MPHYATLPPEIRTRFDVVRRTVRAGTFRWSILSVRDSNRLVDAITPEQFAADERFPYWADLWASSLALARVLREDRALADQTVLELGCGLGLAGIAAAQAGARVLFSDYQEDALTFARANAGANLDRTARERISFRAIDWRTMTDPPGRFDLVIGADITYDRTDFPYLIAAIRSCLKDGARALLAEPGRRVGEDFRDAAAQAGFTLSSRTVSFEYEGRERASVVSELRLEANLP